jgi:hypothetical protein
LIGLIGNLWNLHLSHQLAEQDWPNVVEQIQIDGDDFSVNQIRFGRVIASTLKLQRRMLIVDFANPQK